MPLMPSGEPHTPKPEPHVAKVAAFYRFTRIGDPESVAGWVDRLGRAHTLLGTVLVAPEGINSTLCGTPADVTSFFESLATDPRFTGLDIKFSTAAEPPFKRWKVRLKQEIVTMGVPGVDPNAGVGTYVPPRNWNALISRPDVLLIDCRNTYEIELGTFRGAVDPGTSAFNEFPEYAQRLESNDQPVAMFCTGGIRCEKATAYLRQLGHNKVYHLEGGILRYLEEIPPSESLFHGECFVFDERIGLDGSLQPSR